MNAREKLDEIQQRADRMATPDPTGQHTYQVVDGSIAPDTYLADADRQAGDYDPIGHIASDLGGLVAALRTVLAYADRIDHPEHYENAEREEICRTCHERNPFRGGAYWPCENRKTAEAIRSAITEKLSA